MKSFIVVKQSPRFPTVTYDELFDDNDDVGFYEEDEDKISGTITYYSDSNRLKNKDRRFRVRDAFTELQSVVSSMPDEFLVPITKDQYESFYIPKRSGGLREISKPKEGLAEYQSKIRDVLINTFGAKELYHTNAYAYIDHRSTVECVKKHALNKSRWFLKCDLSNFFGSVTPDFLLAMMRKVYPFSEVDNEGRTAENRQMMLDILKKALNVAFMDGGLPQGTVLSPLLTNIMMIPIDYELSKLFKNLDGEHFVYTRYADDFYISCRYDFDYKNVLNRMKCILEKYDAPFTFKPEKTRYGSSAGSNWMLGVMLNKDNNITIGHRRKKQLSQMVFNYAMDRKNNKPWDLHDVQILLGQIGWLKQVEGDESANGLLAYVGAKTGVDVYKQIKTDLNPSN